MKRSTVPSKVQHKFNKMTFAINNCLPIDHADFGHPAYQICLVPLSVLPLEIRRQTLRRPK
jgi:hypothetical protein